MVSNVLSGARVHGSQPDPWDTMISGASLSTLEKEGSVAGWHPPHSEGRGLQLLY